jgi:hypothetical protein
MRISHKLKLLFLSNPKCGSFSIRILLDKHIEPIDHTYIKSARRGKTEFYNHINAPELISLFCKYKWDWDSYLKITTIRNPFSKMVSLYVYNKPDKNLTPFYRPGYDESTAFQVGFKEWLKAFCREDPDMFRISNFCYDKDRNCLVDHILKIETIHDTLPPILKKVGIGVSRIPHENISRHKPYWEYYDAESRAIVEKYFGEDIKIGNYEFMNGQGAR